MIGWNKFEVRSLKTSILSLVLVHQLILVPGLDRQCVQNSSSHNVQIDMSAAKDGKVIHACVCVYTSLSEGSSKTSLNIWG